MQRVADAFGAGELAPPDFRQILSERVLLARCADDALQPSVELPLLHWPHEGPALTGHTARLTESDGRADMLSFGGKAPGGVITNLLWRVEGLQPRDGSDLEAGKALTRPSLNWRLLASAGSTPAPRYCHAAVEISRGWLIFGGWAQGRQASQSVAEEGVQIPDEGPQLNRGTLFLSDLHVLNLPAMSWSALNARGAVPRGRCQCVMVAAPDEEVVLVFGGACHSDPQPGQSYGDMVMDLSDVVLLHLPTLTWLPPTGLPAPRACV